MSEKHTRLPAVISDEEENSEPVSLIYELTRDIARFIAPIILFVGGIGLLIAQIPTWSLVLGIPAIQIGTAMVILSFDNSARKSLKYPQYHIVKCQICKSPTAVPLGETHGICPDCRVKPTHRSFGRQSHV